MPPADERPYNLHDVVKRSGRDYGRISRNRARLGIGTRGPKGQWLLTAAEADQLATAVLQVPAAPRADPAPRPPAGYSRNAVARMLGVDRLTARAWCAQLGIAHGAGVLIAPEAVTRLAAFRDAGGRRAGGKVGAPPGARLPAAPVALLSQVPAPDLRAALRAARPPPLDGA